MVVITHVSDRKHTPVGAPTGRVLDGSFLPRATWEAWWRIVSHDHRSAVCGSTRAPCWSCHDYALAPAGPLYLQGGRLYALLVSSWRLA